MTNYAVFEIPCRHPAAKDGVFHCLPSHFGVLRMEDGYEFFMADTSKLVTRLMRDNPELLNEADCLFKLSTTTGFLNNISFSSPQITGLWSHNHSRGLSMLSGTPAVIRLAHELDLPCVPIAFDGAIGLTVINNLREEIGDNARNMFAFISLGVPDMRQLHHRLGVNSL